MTRSAFLKKDTIITYFFPSLLHDVYIFIYFHMRRYALDSL